MPHNPRRQRMPEGTDPALTSERISDALERGLVLRRKAAFDPNDAHTITLNVNEATRTTTHGRSQTHGGLPLFAAGERG